MLKFRPTRLLVSTSSLITTSSSATESAISTTSYAKRKLFRYSPFTKITFPSSLTFRKISSNVELKSTLLKIMDIPI